MKEDRKKVDICYVKRRDGRSEAHRGVVKVEIVIFGGLIVYLVDGGYVGYHPEEWVQYRMTSREAIDKANAAWERGNTRK